ncbi:MAG: hypothetical protein HY755_01240 [Nitrospirae bacterium]|nr:hypothetical protein [Nitrospirota bacterium]MBI4849247.1 hypothetical protein [Nitrospirota bacterium]
MSLTYSVVEKEGGKYHIRPADPEIQPNITVLEPVIGEERLLQVIEEFGRYETDGKFTLPIEDNSVFAVLWNSVCAQLKFTDAKFGESSFQLNEVRISLTPKVNHFLAEDLLKLSRLEEDKLKGTSLTSWIDNTDLSNIGDVSSERELYFPFPYDRYQLQVLKIINNKAAVVQGPPGTGKSQTIANLLCHLAANGKRVLFVSQKAQALKVVKDKLNELKINGRKLKYLYGYIPNLSSPQLDESDEMDGIAPQLAGLSQYLTELEHHKGEQRTDDLCSIVEKKESTCKSFNEAIEEQRLLYQCVKEAQALNDYAVHISSATKFKTNFAQEVKERTDSLLSKERILQKSFSNYSGPREKLDKKFALLKLKENKYSELVKRVRDDVQISGYDGHLQFLRKLNNIRRRLFTQGSVFSELPREIRDYISLTLDQDISRAKATAFLDELFSYCRYYEQQKELDDVQSELHKTLAECGLSLDEFYAVHVLIAKANFTDVKHKIIRRNELGDVVRQLKCQDPNTISQQLTHIEKTRRERVVIYLQNLINNGIKKQFGNIEIRRIINKLAKAFGKSRKAYKTFDTLKRDSENFKTILGLVPVWIMELEDASRLIPLESAIFDYVIFDESSQCNLAYAMPSMYRATLCVFFGDSEQMRDTTVRFKTNRAFEELASRYKIPSDLNIKPSQEAVQSILDMAHLQGFLSKVLQYHYRSPRELIGFSNRHFYEPKGKGLISLNTNYLTYKDTNRIMLIHQVDVSWNKEFSDGINISEAEKVLEIVRSLKNDERYRSKSIGILSFFNSQAAYMRKILEGAGYTEDDDVKVSVVEGIQGDEKDVVIYSFVISASDQKNRYISLTGEGGEINKDIAAGRVNVAFSRARQQIHCVISMPVDRFPEGIWIDKFLKHVEKHGEIDFYATELKPFDSYFEEEFYHIANNSLQNPQYIIRNQVKSCGFKIDFVISNPRNGKKIAVECDGPMHFNDEIDEECGIYIESDEERQRILEDAGYRGCFHRVKYSDWIRKDFDRNKIIQDIVSSLS